MTIFLRLCLSMLVLQQATTSEKPTPPETPLTPELLTLAIA